eukprot:GILJ01002600.1.p1 GENE.GILJ01002600.1~~GILJ01002600.1.p1  ORF type:complete len:539 (-),score=75.68 GILJ01002600.1:179-1672(-)
MESMKFQWEHTCKSSAISERTAQQSFVFAHKMYVFGGKDETLRNDLNVFDFKTQQWTDVRPTGALPEPRMAHTGCLIEDKFYVCSGWNGTRVLNDLHVLDLQGGRRTPHWAQPAITHGETPKRQFHTCNVYGHKLIVFGGGNGRDWMDQVFEFDVCTGEWKELTVQGGKAPQGRLQHCAAIMGSELLVFGGEPDNTHQLNDIHIFNLDSQFWTTPVVKGPPPCPRVATSALLVGYKVYFFGGYDGQNWLDDLHILDTYKWEWHTPEVEGTLPSARVRHSALLYDNSMYIFGGNGRHCAFNDLWKMTTRYEPAIHIAKDTVQGDLKQLVNNPQFSDFRFIVDQETIYAHKAIICVRCPQFHSMFTHGMRESSMDHLVISDTRKEVFMLLLEYLYTGTLEQLPAELAHELLAVSNLYTLERLKNMCELVLARELDDDNAAVMFQEADFHCAAQLRQAAFGYVMAYFDRVSVTKSFSELSRELAMEIFDSRQSSSQACAC